MAKTITVIIGDFHVGSTTALAPLQYEIHTKRSDEVQVVEANRLQRWLNECWVDYWEYVRSLAGITGKRRKNRIVVLSLGEICDNNHHDSNQLVHEIEDQVAMAKELLYPVADMADAFYGVAGTDVHSGASGNLDFQLYEDLGAKDYGQNLTFDIDGTLVNIAHHGRAGKRPWTSQAASMLTEVIYDCAERGEPVPQYVFRGHNHIIDDSGEKSSVCRVICTPSWQLRTSFGTKVSSIRQRSDIGGVILNGNTLDMEKARYKGQADIRKVIKV